MISACCAYLPNLSSLSRSVFPNSLYLFALPHFTRIPVTRLILSPKKLQIVPNCWLTRHVMHWRHLCPGQGLELSLFTSFAWFPGILSCASSLGLSGFTKCSPRECFFSKNCKTISSVKPDVLGLRTTCYGLLTLVGRSHCSQAVAAVAASTTVPASTALRTIQSKVNQHQSCMECWWHEWLHWIPSVLIQYAS